jgi:hypothetical protein
MSDSVTPVPRHLSPHAALALRSDNASDRHLARLGWRIPATRGAQWHPGRLARGRLRRQDHARDEVIEGMGVMVVKVPAWRCLLEPDVVAQEVRRLAD